MRHLRQIITAVLLAAVVGGAACSKSEPAATAAGAQKQATTRAATTRPATTRAATTKPGAVAAAAYRQVVFVIDASASMAVAPPTWRKPALEAAKGDLLLAIGCLQEYQDFHVVALCNGRVVEAPGGGLVPASDDNKLAAAKFVHSLVGSGRGDLTRPVGRALDVLAAKHRVTPDEVLRELRWSSAMREGPRNGKAILLLTDGAFTNPYGLLGMVRQTDQNGAVPIYTFLYGPACDEASVDVVRKLAARTGARFKRIERP